MLSTAGALRLPLKTSFLAWTYAIFWTFFLTLQTVWTYKQFLISKIFKHYQSRSINKKNHLELVESKTFRWLAFAHLDKPIGCSLMMKIMLMMVMIIIIFMVMRMHIMVILLSTTSLLTQCSWCRFSWICNLNDFEQPGHFFLERKLWGKIS